MPRIRKFVFWGAKVNISTSTYSTIRFMVVIANDSRARKENNSETKTISALTSVQKGSSRRPPRRD